MKASFKGFNLIKFYETLHDGDLTLIGLQPKLCPADVWTEGYGHAIIDHKTGKHLKGIENKSRAYELSVIKTEEDAENVLKSDIKIIEKQINTLSFTKKMNQNQYDAFISFVFNVGFGNLLYCNDGNPSTIYNLIKQDVNHPKIAEAFCMWVKVTGVGYLKGLARRRISEADLYFS